MCDCWLETSDDAMHIIWIQEKLPKMWNTMCNVWESGHSGNTRPAASWENILPKYRYFSLILRYRLVSKFFIFPHFFQHFQPKKMGKLVNMGNLQEILTENWLIRNSNFWWIFYPCATHFKFRYFSLKSPKIPSFSWGKGKISTYPHSPMFPIHQNTCWTSLLLRPVNQHPS